MSANRRYRFAPIPSRIKLPRNCTLGDIPAIAVDSADRLYIYQRGTPPVMVFDSKGRFLRSFGHRRLLDAHGVCIDRDDHLWCVDRATNCVRKFSTHGKLLLTLNPTCRRGRPGAPFRLPTGVAIGAGGTIYVSDGYANARVHKFDPSGRRKRSWGRPGRGRGEFRLPHGIAIDPRGSVYVCDRENHRIQVFDAEGAWRATWTGFKRPSAIAIALDGTLFVAEMGGCVSILNDKGQRLGSIKGGFSGEPHGICLDSKGSLYVSEVAPDTASRDSPRPCRIYKFRRIA